MKKFLLLTIAYTAGVSAKTLGEVAGTMTIGATWLSKLLVAACFVSAICFFVMAFTHFKNNSLNAKLVPISVPITYLVLSIFLASIPFLDLILGFTTSKPESAKKTGAVSYERYHKQDAKGSFDVEDIDAPIYINEE